MAILYLRLEPLAVVWRSVVLRWLAAPMLPVLVSNSGFASIRRCDCLCLWLCSCTRCRPAVMSSCFEKDLALRLWLPGGFWPAASR